MSDVARAYVQMLTKSADAPEHVIAGILACEADAVQPLVDMLKDRSLDAAGHPVQGIGRRHAAELLGHLGEVAAVDPLVDVLVADRAQAPLVKAVADALARIHASEEGGIAGRLLDRVDGTDELASQMMVAMVLASGKMRDPRATELLRRLLPEDPDIVLPLVSNYADPALAPDVAQILLGAEGNPRRVIQAVHTLAVLGHEHPKLIALSQKADEVLRHEVSRELMMGLAPDLAVILRGIQADQQRADEAEASATE